MLREDPTITMLVNNAGVGSVASILQADVNKMEAMIDLNITALTRLTYAVAPAFVARGKGAIINISSAVAIAVENLNGVYSASKVLCPELRPLAAERLGREGRANPDSAAGRHCHGVLGHRRLRAAEDVRNDHAGGRPGRRGPGRLRCWRACDHPSPPRNFEAWTRWEQERREMAAKFRNPKPAPHYHVA